MKKLVFLILFLMGVNALLVAQTCYYVVPQGSRTAGGGADTSFSSIEQAQLHARNTPGDVTIYLRAGVYRLDKPLVFTPEDCRQGKRLTVCAYPGEKVTITGGIPLDLTWKPYKEGIMKAKLKGYLSLDMLVADGTIRHMARYPNYDSTAVRFNGTAADAIAPERVKKWKNPAGGYLHAMHLHDWGDFHYRFTGKDKDGNLTMEGGWQNNRQLGIHKKNRMVENSFEELDAPGEWYYSSEEETLYYYPMPNEDVRNVNFETPRIKHLIEFRGSEQQPVRNITVAGVELTQTLRTFMEPYEQLLRSDWTIYRGGAVIFEGTENCALKESYLHNMGGNAVFFSNYNRNSEVSGSHFTNIGASAICFVGNPDAVRSPSFEYNEFVPAENIDRTRGPKTNNYPSHCLVHDNLIHDIGLFEKQITGVELSMCKAITVSHNSIYDTPRAGINISEGTWGGHILEFNDIFDTVKETGDHGSFNSWGRDRFWHSDLETMRAMVANEPALVLADAIETVVIRNNRFRCDRGWDIDLDDGSTNYHIYNNLCLNGGIKLREGFYRVVENNILINNTFHPHVWFKNSGDVFTRNIVMSEYKPINILGWGAQTDYNIFTDSLAYNAALKNGTDEHSIVTLVRFANPAEGNYQIADDSEAIIKCGFHNFPMDRFGVCSARLKKLAKQPQMSTPIIATNAENKDIITWCGTRIKNLDTLGERSATGMSSERGVYVISIDALGSVLRDYIKPNDAILNFGGFPVDNLDDLYKAIQKTDLSKPIKIVIFRTQKENTLIIPGKVIKTNIR